MEEQQIKEKIDQIFPPRRPGRPRKYSKLPERADQVEPRLTMGQLAVKFGVDAATAKRWRIKTGYHAVDGRTLSSGVGNALTEEEKAFRLKILHENSGETLEYVGSLLGVSRQRAEQIYKQLKIPRTNMSKKKLLINRISKDQMTKLVEDGYSLSEISRMENMHVACVAKLLKAYGLTPWGNKTRRMERDGIRYCNSCKQTKPITEFYPSQPPGHACKICMTTYYKLRRVSEEEKKVLTKI